MTDLNFQSFGNDFSVNSTNEQGGFGGSLGDRDRNTLVDDNVSSSGTGKNIFSFSFYQQFFDVDTDQVVKRVLNSVIPTNNNFILDFVQPLPDLWGPFWISVTLVFSIGIFGNIAQYIGNDGEGNYGSDFRLVTSASVLIFLYVVFVPLGLFAILWHRKSDLQYPYIDIVCAYGYSLTIFIPVSLLWMLNINWFRWVLIFTSVALSGGVLAKAIYPAFKNDTNRLVAMGSVITVFLLHFLLAYAFKEMFFDAVHPLKTPSPAASQVFAEATLSTSVAANMPILPANVTEPGLPINSTEGTKPMTSSSAPSLMTTSTTAPQTTTETSTTSSKSSSSTSSTTATTTTAGATAKGNETVVGTTQPPK